MIRQSLSAVIDKLIGAEQLCDLAIVRAREAGDAETLGSVSGIAAILSVVTDEIDSAYIAASALDARPRNGPA